jgi:hypothetical protein
MSQTLTAIPSLLIENNQIKYVNLLQVEIFTADNLKIVGNLAPKFFLNDKRQNIEKLSQTLQQESKYLHLTDVKIYKDDRHLFLEAAFLDFPKSEIICLRLIPS